MVCLVTSSTALCMQHCQSLVGVHGWLVSQWLAQLPLHKIASSDGSIHARTLLRLRNLTGATTIISAAACCYC